MLKHPNKIQTTLNFYELKSILYAPIVMAPTKYQSYVATHRRKGMTFKQIGAAWRKSNPKPKTKSTTKTTKTQYYGLRKGKGNTLVQYKRKAPKSKPKAKPKAAPKRTYVRKAGPKNVTPAQRRNSKCGPMPPGAQLHKDGRGTYYLNTMNKKCYVTYSAGGGKHAVKGRLALTGLPASTYYGDQYMNLEDSSMKHFRTGLEEAGLNEAEVEKAYLLEQEKKRKAKVEAAPDLTRTSKLESIRQSKIEMNELNIKDRERVRVKEEEILRSRKSEALKAAANAEQESLKKSEQSNIMKEESQKIRNLQIAKLQTKLESLQEKKVILQETLKQRIHNYTFAMKYASKDIPVFRKEMIETDDLLKEIKEEIKLGKTIIRKAKFD